MSSRRQRSIPLGGRYIQVSLYYKEGPFHERFFVRNSNSMENSSYCHPSCSEVIAMTFFTWCKGCAAVACAKYCSDMVHCYVVTLKPIFHRISITMENSFVKRAPGCTYDNTDIRLIYVFAKYKNQIVDT